MARLSDAGRRLEVLGKVNTLPRASPKTGKRMSLRKISQALEDAGHLNEHGRSFNQRSIKSMLES